MITAVLHLSTTATVYMDRSIEEVLADIREQIQSTLPSTPGGMRSDGLVMR